MARVTIEDCIKRVPNPFDLVLFASQRAKELKKGEDSELNKENDKNSVISLREIAKNKVILNDLKNEIIKSFQNNLNLLDEHEDNLKKK